MIESTKYYNIIMNERTVGAGFSCHGPYTNELQQYRALQGIPYSLEQNEVPLWAVVFNTGELRVGRWDNNVAHGKLDPEKLNNNV